MNDKEAAERRDEILRRALNTPPKPKIAPQKRKREKREKREKRGKRST